MAKEESKKTVYQVLRDKKDVSQETAAEEIGINRNILSDIEKDYKKPDADQLYALAKYYDSKRLCHWYCSQKCEVGKYLNLLPVDALQPEDLGHAMMKIYSAIQQLKNLDLSELIEIAKDGIIEESERETYDKIKASIAELAQAYGTLLRIEEDDVDGEIIFTPQKINNPI